MASETSPDSRPGLAVASQKPLRSAGAASQSDKLDPLRGATSAAEAFAGTRDPVELMIAAIIASAQFRLGSAGGPPTVFAIVSIVYIPVTDAGANPSSGVRACVAI